LNEWKKSLITARAEERILPVMMVMNSVMPFEFFTVAMRVNHQENEHH